eukprot:scaffold166030_cov32-Prasinocladus_malaysianus.AAC.1
MEASPSIGRTNKASEVRGNYALARDQEGERNAFLFSLLAGQADPTEEAEASYTDEQTKASDTRRLDGPLRHCHIDGGLGLVYWGDYRKLNLSHRLEAQIKLSLVCLVVVALGRLVMRDGGDFSK